MLGAWGWCCGCCWMNGGLPFILNAAERAWIWCGTTNSWECVICMCVCRAGKHVDWIRPAHSSLLPQHLQEICYVRSSRNCRLTCCIHCWLQYHVLIRVEMSCCLWEALFSPSSPLSVALLLFSACCSELDTVWKGSWIGLCSMDREGEQLLSPSPTISLPLTANNVWLLMITVLMIVMVTCVSAGGCAPRGSSSCSW